MAGAEGNMVYGGTAPEFEVVALEPVMVERAASTLVEAFKSEETANYHLDTSRPSTLRRMGLIYGVLMRMFLEAGRPVLAARSDKDIQGVIILRDPRKVISKRRIAVLIIQNLFSILPHMACRPVRSLRIMAATRHPDGLTRPYFTVEMLGVHPGCQGRGVGGTLIRAAQARGEDDAAVSGVYLNTASEKNRAFYENLGFDTLCVNDLGTVKVYHLFWQNPAFG
ncbi:MAG: GNAT family N-acetyltransferase [Actinomycetota bacterium]